MAPYSYRLAMYGCMVNKGVCCYRCYKCWAFCLDCCYLCIACLMLPFILITIACIYIFNLFRDIVCPSQTLARIMKKPYNSSTYYNWVVNILSSMDYFLCPRPEYIPTLKHPRSKWLERYFRRRLESMRKSSRKDERLMLRMVIDYIAEANDVKKEDAIHHLLKASANYVNHTLIRLLFELVEDVNKPFIVDLQLLRPLKIAMRTDDVEFVRQILDRGADVNVEHMEYQEESFLFWSVHNSQLEMTKLLLERGANIHERNRKGEGLLHWVATHMSEPINRHMIIMLFDLGLSIESKNKNGETALAYAVENPSVMKFFLDYCDISQAALDDALWHAAVNETAISRYTMRMLLLRGADPDAVMPSKPDLPIDMCVKDERDWKVAELLRAGADAERAIMHNRNQMSAEVRQVFIKHAAQQLFKGRPMNEFCVEALNINRNSLFTDCTNELHRMSTEQIAGAPFIAVLYEDEGLITQIIQRPECVEIFVPTVRHLFPIHQHDLIDKFYNMRRKWNCRWKMEEAVGGIYNGLLPFTAVRRIVDYLRPEDICVKPSLESVDEWRDFGLHELAYPHAGRNGVVTRKRTFYWRRNTLGLGNITRLD